MAFGINGREQGCYLVKIIGAEDNFFYTQVVYADKEHISHNEVLTQILDVLYHLVNYGYYDSTSDVQAILTPLVTMLTSKAYICIQHYRWLQYQIHYTISVLTFVSYRAGKLARIQGTWHSTGYTREQSSL